MSQKFHNGGRTYRPGKAETDAELAARLARARQADHVASIPDLVAMLTECVRALDEEVWAAGDDIHPTINEHAKIAHRARKLLASLGHPVR